MAVDNEPAPFWTGDDEVERVEAWKAAVGWTSDWGVASPAKGFNGPSGAWVAEKVLAPLGAVRDDAWITDCLDTYRCSTDLQRRLTDTYAPFAARRGLPSPTMARHPSESQIVREGVTDHRGRLLAELDEARPELIVTLGNAALRVMRRLVEAEDVSRRNVAVSMYGQRLAVRVDGRHVEWLPLAHPAAPRAYQEAHARWVATTSR